MENELTLEELYLLLEVTGDMKYQDQKFLAALQGVDLEEGKKDNAFEKVKQRAAAELKGRTEEEFVLDTIGIEIEEDD